LSPRCKRRRTLAKANRKRPPQGGLFAAPWFFWVIAGNANAFPPATF